MLEPAGQWPVGLFGSRTHIETGRSSTEGPKRLTKLVH